MNKEQLYELLRLDPYQVPGEVEYWALYAKSFYEDLFGKIDDPKKLKSLYQYVLKNKKLRNRDRDALTFFYYLRLDELEDPNFWDKVGKKNIEENMKAKLVKEEITPADQGFIAARKDNARGSRIVDYANDLQNAITDLIEMGQLSEDELPEKDLQILMEANKIARKLEIKFGDEEHGITSVM
jgi:hypothetical protein